jgi:hypothetical protein
MSDDLASDAERLLSEAQPEASTLDVMEEWIVATLTDAMQHAQKTTEQISAANAAIKYLAVKAKLPVAYGSGFDE